MSATVVTAPAELAGAISSGAEVIEVQGTISGSPMITLPPGVTLRAGTLEFGAKGVRLTKDNTLDGATVLTTDDEPAILNDTDVPELGTLTLRDVTARGQVLLVADDQVRAGHIQIAGLHVRSADVRGRALRPHGFGIEALQGGLTIWNRQADPAVRITAVVLDVSVGTEEARCAAAVCSWRPWGTGTARAPAVCSPSRSFGPGRSTRMAASRPARRT